MSDNVGLYLSLGLKVFEGVGGWIERYTQSVALYYSAGRWSRPIANIDGRG
jgi:hypothetical protein